MGESASSKASDDMSWGEVAQLGLRYGKIPLALLAVEALYWFITQPSDTLALIQVTEAYIWNEVTHEKLLNSYLLTLSHRSHN